MTTDSEQHAAALERLSALMDGELDGAPVAQACAQWHASAESRSGWHAYHLIGDVLRSDDLATDPARDAVFLQAFRARLASGPVVLAPQPRAAMAPAVAVVPARAVGGARSSRWSWMAPTAVAAGFVAVAGVLVLTRVPGAAPEREALAGSAITVVGAAPTLAAGTMGSPMAIASEPQTSVATGELIRDARLDRYLAAHKQFAGSSALGVPSAFLRNATAEAPGR